jgi:hypothetical protein
MFRMIKALVDNEDEHSFSARMRRRRLEFLKSIISSLPKPVEILDVEPHFLVPLFQFLPLGLRTFLLRKFNLGWIKRVRDARQAKEVANSIRLMAHRELEAIFPGAVIHKEKVFGLTKSFIVESVTQ